MDTNAIQQWILEELSSVESIEVHGYTMFFFGPDRKLPFATLAASDNEHDRCSQLNRESVYRLNLGVSNETYRSLFGPLPSGLGPSGTVETGHDFTVLDQWLPHPFYAPQSWICILSPSQATFRDQVEPVLREAHEIARQRHLRREGEHNASA